MHVALGVRARGSVEPAAAPALVPALLLLLGVLLFALTPPLVAAALLVGYPVLPPAMPDWTGPLLLGINSAQLAGVAFVALCARRTRDDL